MTPDLSRLLRPRSVAVFGGGWGANVVEQLVKAGFEGEIWPVHPTREAVSGIRAYPSLDALPAPPDAAWIGVNRDATIDIVRDLAAGGAGGAVCFASGFRETADGADRNAALLMAAGDMPVIGPNCYGLLNYLDGATLWPDQHGGRRVERGVAILTQSSNIAINLTMQRRGLPIAYMMTAGNQAQIGLADMAHALLEDERVTAIGLHIEGVGDPAAFEALALAARERKIPIIALKVGTSEQAQIATISHTASLAGSQAGSDAFFARLGIPLVAGLPELVETLKLLHVHAPLAGRRILSMSCSGGEASLMADTATRHGLDFPPYTEARREAISATLNPLVTVANPLDYHTFIWGDEAAMTETFAAAMTPGFDLSMLVIDFPRTDRCSDESWNPAVAAIAAAANRVGYPAAVIASLGELLPEDRCDAFTQMGIAPLCGLDEALAAADASACIHESWSRLAPTPTIRALAASGEPVLLDEITAKTRLAAAGVPVPPGQAVTRIEQAREIAPHLGFPLAIKGMGIAHKTEAGAVFLNVSDAASVEAITGDLLTRCDAVLIEAMVPDGLAELIVGITRDPVYGPMLIIGAGGVMAELLDDTATLLLPSSKADIAAALASLKVAKLLNGWRGKPPADIDAAINAIHAIARFAEANAGSLEELDVNPLIVCEQGVWAADALIRIRNP